MSSVLNDTRALWAAVIGQAKEDIEFLPVGSADYVQAVAFLTRDHGPWAMRRAEICGHIDLDPGELSRLAMGWVRARRLSEGMPADEPRPAKPAPIPVPVISLEAVPEPAGKKAPLPILRSKVRRGYNPFMPHLRLERPFPSKPVSRHPEIATHAV